MKNEKYKISAEEFSKVSLTRLSNSPSSPSQYNGARLGAEDLKKRMDAPLELFRDKLNALVAFLLGEGDDSAVAHISTGIKEGHTISQMLKDIISESAEFASYLSVGEKSLLKKLEGIDLSLANMGKELGNCVDKDNYERDINSIIQDMSSHKETARAAIEALGRELSDTEAELIESIAQALTSAKKYADDTKVGKIGDQTISGALSISGDLLVSGNTYAKQMESLEVGDAVIIANADGVLLSELSGYVIRVKGTEAYAIVYDPADDCVKIGLGMYNSDTKVFTFLEGEAQVLATRADIADGNIPAWDNDKKTFRDSGYKVGDFAKKGDVSTSVANALIGSEMGVVVALKDVSRIGHNLEVKVASKNLFDVSKVKTGGTVVNNGDGTITVRKEGGNPCGSTFGELCPDLKVGDVFTFSLRVTNAVEDTKEGTFIYLVELRTSVKSGTTLTTTQDMLNSSVYLYTSTSLNQGNVTEGIVSEIQVELDTTATPYTPYVANLEAVKVIAQGKNFINSPNKTVSGTTAWYSEKLGSYTLPNGTYAISCDVKKSASAVPCIKLLRLKDGSGVKEHAVISNGKMTTTFTVDDSYGGGITIFLYSNLSGNAVETSCIYSNIQVELDTATKYEPYKEPIEYAYGEEIKSIYPSTTLMTDTEGAVISVEYNRDINKAFEELMNLILSLGGNVYV